MLNWESFNEVKSNRYELTVDLIEDYFLSIQDLGYKIHMELGVCQEELWMPISDCECGAITEVGFFILIENIFLSNMNPDENNSMTQGEWKMPDLEKFSKLISEITNICKRITTNYKNGFSIRLDDWSARIIFIKPVATLYDACYISYQFLTDYMTEILNHINIECELGKSGIYGKSKYISDVNFVEKNKNYFIELTINEEFSNNSIPVKDFKVHFEEIVNSIFGSYKYDSFEKIKNKYIIKNFISTDDIKFKY